MGSVTGDMSRARRVVTRVATVAVFVALALLGVRTLISLDLGYNLEYGQSFLRDGRIVDHVDFLYTQPARDLPPDELPAPGPGAWYDSEGRYRFVNANWLSQVVMAAVYGVAGTPGLGILAALLSAGVYVLVFLAARRLGVPMLPAAIGLGVYALTAQSRFNLRPELFGFVCLAAQLALLCAAARDPRRAAQLSWPVIGALLALQVLFVNSHSYFLLGIGVALAIGLGWGLRWGVDRLRGGSDVDSLRRAALRMGVLVAGLAVSSFVNPWTWRLAVLPVETLLYLREHAIGGGHGEHPWSHIAELQGPFRAPFPYSLSDYTLVALVALGALGAAVALFRGRWPYVLAIAGMMLTASSMTRNVAPAGIVVVPFALAALAPASDRLSVAGVRGRLGAAAEVSVAVLVLGLSLYVSARIVSNRFYEDQGSYARFGLGIGRTPLPIGAAQWITRHLDHPRIWCDTDSSSTLRFFTRPKPELPILTNQWAYPPAVMTWNQRIRAGEVPYGETFERYGVDVVVLRTSTSARLFSDLARSGDWTLVHVEGEHVVLLRSDGPTAAAAAEYDLARYAGDPGAYVREQRAVDPLVQSSLIPAGRCLLAAGATDLAIAVLEAAALEVDDDPRLWAALGSAHASRGDRRRQAGESGPVPDFLAARDCFRKALELRPEYEFARRTLVRVEEIVATSHE